MSIRLRNSFTVQIGTTLILEHFHGYFGLLPPSSPLPQIFLIRRPSAEALLSLGMWKEQNTIKACYLPKYLRQVSKKRLGGVSLHGGISIMGVVKQPKTKNRALQTV